MASLFTKNQVFYVRFRHAGSQFKRSLETKDEAFAQYRLTQIKTFLEGIKRGHEIVPAEVAPGPFIVSLGNVKLEVQSPPPTPNPGPGSDVDITIPDVLEDYLKYRSRKNSDGYVYTQRCHFSRFSQYLNQPSVHSLTSITGVMLEDFLWDALSDLQASSRRGYRATLKPFFKWLEDRGFIEGSPAAALASIPDDSDQAEFWSTDQIESHAREHGLDDHMMREQWKRVYFDKDEIHDIIDTVRERSASPVSVLLHAIPAYTGCRRGEILRLRHEDINKEHQLITFTSRKQSRKQRETRRIMPIMDDLQSILDDCLPAIRDECAAFECSDYVLRHPGNGKQINGDRSYSLLRQPLRGTKWQVPGKNEWFKVLFHNYRHSFISNLACDGTDQRFIDKWVGHTTEKMSRLYRHFFPSAQREAINVLSRAKNDGN